MNLEQAVLDKLRELPPNQQQEVLNFAEFLHFVKAFAYRIVRFRFCALEIFVIRKSFPFHKFF